MAYCTIPIAVTLKSPWCVPDSNTPGNDLDIRLARNRAGQFVLPGTLVRGVLRGAAEAIADTLSAPLRAFDGATADDMRSTVFGKLSPEGSNDPIRGIAIIGDLSAKAAPDPSNARTVRVEIDPDTGAALEGHLLYVECPYPHGMPITFTGEIVVTGPNTAERAQHVAALCEMALPRIPAIGGMKSAGFGKLTDHYVGTPEQRAVAQVKAPFHDLTVRYALDRPFLVATTQFGSNFKKGSDVLPGTAIKAVIARAFADEAMQEESFVADLHISNARPIAIAGDGIARPVRPLSLAIETRGRSDRMLVCTLHAPAAKGLRRFASDWKGEEENWVKRTLGTREPAFLVEDIPTEARTRTAIDSASGGALVREGGGSLFSECLVVPDNRVWLGTLRTGTGPVDDLCGLLATGIPGFGSTGAVLSGEVAALYDSGSGAGSDITLTLQSDAHLFFGVELRERLKTDSDALAALYNEYFAEHGFELVDFRASQRLLGGYLALRYPIDTAAGYQPWLVTEAGSTFRLRVQAEANIADVLARGLKPAQPEGASWQTFPFFREVGYGAVRDDTALLTNIAAGTVLAETSA